MDNIIHWTVFVYNNIKQAHNEKDIDDNGSGNKYSGYNCV